MKSKKKFDDEFLSLTKAIFDRHELSEKDEDERDEKL